MMPALLSMLRAAFVLLAAFTLLTGVAYPLLITGIAQTVFHDEANGSLIEDNGKVVGSELLGQRFTEKKYFWGRPSATTPPYNAAASGASNLSPGNPKLVVAIEARVAALKKADPGNDAPVPIELVTASASGLDPHISPAAAEYQVSRVAKARRMKEDGVRALILEHTEGRTFGFIGEERVNVLKLNLALDKEGFR